MVYMNRWLPACLCDCLRDVSDHTCLCSLRRQATKRSRTFRPVHDPHAAQRMVGASSLAQPLQHGTLIHNILLS